MLMAISMVSCSKLKTYTYTFNSIDRWGDEKPKTEVIKAMSDSLAFIDAYERRFISESVFYDMLVLLKDSASFSILDFSLTDNTGADVLSIPFANRDSILKSMYNEIVMPSKLKYESMLADMEQNRIKAEKLKPYFNFRFDDFDKCTWVTPKDAPGLSDNGFYCYFSLVNGRACNLRLKIQYSASDWLFVQSFKLLIDDDSFGYDPGNIERDHSTFVWEWSDAPVTSYSNMLLNSLVLSKKAKIRFIGKQYHKDKDITPKQLTSIKRTMDLFYALGGKID